MVKDGKQLEKIVQLIEKSISPESKVEHDVQMPILNSRTGATTQCDIVIRSGTGARETITIVEVQDRTSKVKPNDFRGWQQKLKEVGAQHLLCVSRQEFPKSIKEQASLTGNSILLITIKESNPENLPLDFIRFTYKYTHFQLTALNLVQPSFSKSEAIKLGIRDTLLKKKIISGNETVWSLDKKHLLSLFVLCRDYYPRAEKSKSGSGEINFDSKNGLPLYYSVSDKFIRAGLNCKFEWTCEVIEQPVSVLTYEQDEYGALAWVAEIEHDSPKGKLLVRIPLIKSGDHYIMNSLYAELPKDTEFSLFKTQPTSPK